jgi:L-aminopeptidase/D-esterase-like protein
MYSGCITDITGVCAGHYTDKESMTGCTVVLIDGNGGVCGVDVRGSAPGTRETDLLRPLNTVQNAHAILLSGGSAFGLAATDGVMRWLEVHERGFDTGYARVPIVPAAVLYDLGIGSADVRPGADAGYAACEIASAAPLSQGLWGAGTGATVGKAAGMARAQSGGFGAASVTVGNGVIVAACFAVNALGDIYDHTTGQKIAGMSGMTTYEAMTTVSASDMSGKNTTIGIVGTNAALTKEQANKLAAMGQDGIAMCIRPAHTMFDGDTVFAFGTGETECDIHAVLAAGAEVSARAIINAVLAAKEGDAHD